MAAIEAPDDREVGDATASARRMRWSSSSFSAAARPTPGERVPNAQRARHPARHDAYGIFSYSCVAAAVTPFLDAPMPVTG